MNFSDALQMLKSGQSIKRFAWLDTESLHYRSATDLNYDTHVVFNMMWIEQGSMADMWNPQQEDILAEDWMVIE